MDPQANLTAGLGINLNIVELSMAALIAGTGDLVVVGVDITVLLVAGGGKGTSGTI